MSATIAVTCGNCKKSLNVPSALKGKRIRCKNCGQAMAVEEPKPADEEWGSVISGYGVSEHGEKIRCPYCAAELENETIVVCMDCGYNLRTRERMEQKILHEVTGGDYTLWLLPGIANALGVILCIVFIVMIWARSPDFGEYMNWLQDWLWARVYSTVTLLFIIYVCGYFAFKRLVLNPHPPDKAKRPRKEVED